MMGGEICIQSESELDEKLHYDEDDEFLLNRLNKKMGRAMVIASDDGEVIDFS